MKAHKTTTPAEHLDAMAWGLEALDELGAFASSPEMRDEWRKKARKVQDIMDRYHWDLENGG